MFSQFPTNAFQKMLIIIEYVKYPTLALAQSLLFIDGSLQKIINNNNNKFIKLKSERKISW